MTGAPPAAGQAARLVTAWEVRQAVGVAPAVVRVKNLKSTVSGPPDAWGRGNSPQPVAVSAEVAMAQPFGSSAATDAVSRDTVHYGTLSKRMLATIAALNEMSSFVPGTGFRYHVGMLLDGLYLAMEVLLPKASLLGSGISMAASLQYSRTDDGPAAVLRSLTCKIHDLRVPTLIGVNPHERQAKQVVVANIQVDRVFAEDLDLEYRKLETVVVKAMEDSSFETLEALAGALAGRVTSYLRSECVSPDGLGWDIEICLEKPTAVAAADAACVELRVKTKDASPLS